MRVLLILLFLFFARVPLGFCVDAPQAMQSTTQAVTIQVPPIYNLNDVLKTVKGFVKIPVLFPTLVKGEVGKIYFAHTDLQENYAKAQPEMQYYINISYQPDCFAHYCRLGIVSAEFDGVLQTDSSIRFEGDKEVSQEIKKVSVNLANNIQGFYTPGFAGASYTEPKIQWFYKKVLYTIQWQTANQDELVQMANSAILADVGK
jgi:hypothetical protein